MAPAKAEPNSYLYLLSSIISSGNGKDSSFHHCPGLSLTGLLKRSAGQPELAGQHWKQEPEELNPLTTLKQRGVSSSHNLKTHNKWTAKRTSLSAIKPIPLSLSLSSIPSQILDSRILSHGSCPPWSLERERGIHYNVPSTVTALIK